MTELAVQLRAFLAEFPGTSAFDPEDVEALLNERDHWEAAATRNGELYAACENQRDEARAERDRYAALLTEASEALRAVGKAAITVEPTLKQPYPDAPDTSPWARWMEAPARRAYNLGHQIRRELSNTPKEPTT